MEMEFGGPVWHASASAGTESLMWAMAERALRGVGDASRGEWRETGRIAMHIRRRLTDAERQAAGNLQVRDIRGTEEERRRLRRLFRDAPQLKAASRMISSASSSQSNAEASTTSRQPGVDQAQQPSHTPHSRR